MEQHVVQALLEDHRLPCDPIHLEHRRILRTGEVRHAGRPDGAPRQVLPPARLPLRLLLGLGDEPLQLHPQRRWVWHIVV
jgi:hypothetical protein